MKLTLKNQKQPMKNKLAWMKTSLAKVAVGVMMLLLAATTTWGAQLVKWDMSGYSNAGSSPQGATANDANVTIGGLTRGSAVTANTTSKCWGGAFGTTTTTEAGSITAGNYGTFTISANSGYKISIYDIPAYNIRRSSTGPTTGIWQYSTDGTTFTDIGSSITWGSTTSSSGNTEPAIDLSGISALQNVAAGTTITFRIVSWNGTSGGTWYFNDQSSGTSDLIVEGGVSSATTGSFTAGNLAVLQADTASLNNTPISIIELSPSTANQTPAQIISINGSSSGSGVLRNSGNAGTAAGLADSSDGTLLAFTGGNAVSGAANANTITARSAVSMNKYGPSSYTVAATYTSVSGQQIRYATSPNNSTWYMGDQNGIYLNATGPTPASGVSGTPNVRSLRSFGGVVYLLQKDTVQIVVSSVSVNGATLTALPGLAADNSAVDFYMVSSGNNGTYDTLYVLDQTDATHGTINKFSLVSGSWTANSSYATTFGGADICAAYTSVVFSNTVDIT